MFELSAGFEFSAAHRITADKPGREHYARLHGHSFQAVIACEAPMNVATGWALDLGDLEAAAEEIRSKLDKQFLNEIDGLAAPTLEALCVYIWRGARGRGLPVSRVTVRRDSLDQACTLLNDPETQ